MQKKKGIGASSGIAIAKVFLVEEEEISIPKNTLSKQASETLLKKAVEDTISDLENLKELARKNSGDEVADIFEAHIQIAQDPVIQEEIIEELKNTNEHVALITQNIMNKYFEMFSAMDDEYMKARSADVLDVYTRVIKHILGIKIVDLSQIKEEVILVAKDITPSHTAQLNKKYVKGFVTDIGARTSHAAIMARSLEIPAVLGLKDITHVAKANQSIAINGDTGTVIINPDAADIKQIEKEKADYIKFISESKKYLNKETITTDGHKVHLEANIGSVADAKKAMEYGAEGVGLFRTEFLYMDSKDWPTEEEQYNVYKEILEINKGKEVIVRTLDIGGDKHLDYFKFPEEMNPFLGYRAIRLCLDNVGVFKTQLRALIRASSFGKLGIMFPMIATLDEVKRAKKIYQECYDELKKEKVKIGEIKVGIMVEIPSTAVLADQFAKEVDFFSIGTNDLIQYSMAADRMSPQVSYLYQPRNPAIIRLVKMTIDGAHLHGKIAAMCGEMAGEYTNIPILLGLGLDNFSMSATSILKARMLINNISFAECKKLVEKVLQLNDNIEIDRLINKFLESKGV